MIILAFLFLRVHSEFFLLTDLHYDILYQPNYNSSYMCHNIGIQGYNITPFPTNNIQNITRPYCDSSYNLINLTIAKMSEINSSPDFIIITGDTVAHYTSASLQPNNIYNSTYNEELVRQSFRDITSLLLQYFPDTQIIPMLGNNDGYEDYQMPTGYDKSLYLEFLYSVWQPLAHGIPKSFLTDGYYSLLTSSGYNVISMNSNYYSVNIDDVGIQPYIQLVWLKSQLESNTNNLIVMHIPPSLSLYGGGKNSWLDFYTEMMVSIINQYSQKIAAILTGHFHSGYFQLINNIPVIVNPSVSPYFGNNPSFRYFNINLTDFSEYTLNGYKVTGQWRSYSFSQKYGYSLNYTQLYLDIGSGKVDFSNYLKTVSGLWVDEDATYDQACVIIYGSTCAKGQDYIKKVMLCEIMNHSTADFQSCMSTSPQPAYLSTQ